MSKDKRIVYDCPNGGPACIVIPAKPDMDMEVLAKKTVPEGCSYRIISVDDIPEDREFRDAWTDRFDTNTIDVDIEKAKVIHTNRLRVIRDEKLKALDLEFMKAVEKDDREAMKAIGEKKQVLRDLPQNLPLKKVKTVEELKKVFPDELV